MSGTVDTAGNMTLDALPTSVDVNGVAVPVASGDALCPDCLANGFRRTIAGHKHDNAVKVRTGESCPLCGGKFHGREVGETLQDFACAWRQWNKAAYGRNDSPVTHANVAEFDAWLQANPTLVYGKRAQLTAWGQMQASGTFNGKLSPAMASDLDRHLNPKRGAKVNAPSDPNGPTLPTPTVSADATNPFDDVPLAPAPTVDDVTVVLAVDHAMPGTDVTVAAPTPNGDASPLSKDAMRELKRKLQAMQR